MFIGRGVALPLATVCEGAQAGGVQIAEASSGRGQELLDGWVQMRDVS